MKRITLFAGHYGSGKTNIAVNYAFKLRQQGLEVAVADLDIVNPYFRTKDSEKEIYSVIDDRSEFAVMDIGGDDRGAYALGRYSESIVRENDYEMYLVINMYRPLTRDAYSTLEVMNEIEKAASMKFTAIINNSNLGEETTAQDVLDSLKYADEVSKLTGLPVAMTTVKKTLYKELYGKVDNMLPLTLQEKIN